MPAADRSIAARFCVAGTRNFSRIRAVQSPGPLHRAMDDHLVAALPVVPLVAHSLVLPPAQEHFRTEPLPAPAQPAPPPPSRTPERPRLFCRDHRGADGVSWAGPRYRAQQRRQLLLRLAKRCRVLPPGRYGTAPIQLHDSRVDLPRNTPAVTAVPMMSTLPVLLRLVSCGLCLGHAAIYACLACNTLTRFRAICAARKSTQAASLRCRKRKMVWRRVTSWRSASEWFPGSRYPQSAGSLG